MIETTTTTRGFDIAEFRDIYGAKCSLQKSSLGRLEAIWLGVDIDLNGRDVEHGRMHLSQDQVRELLPALTRFAETGEIA
jgi:hypothetical protein